MIPPKGIDQNIEFRDRRLNESLPLPPTRAKYPLQPVEVDNTTTTIFDVENNEYWRIDHITAHNPSSATPTVQFYYVPNGDSAAAANRAFHHPFTANETVPIEALSGAIFGPGDKLQAVSSSADTVNVYGGITRFFSGS